MNPKIIVALIVVLALGVAAYLWKLGVPKAVEPQAETATTTATNEKPEPPIGSVQSGVVGSWRSKDDGKFTREFKANGTVTDRYTGNDDATVSGSWAVVTDRGELPANLRTIDASTVLKLSFPEETLFFIVTEVNASDLTMLYAGSNSTLRFSRQ